MTSDQSAEEHLTNGMIAALAGDQGEQAIAECERALALGLPGEREAHARMILGAEYVRLATRSGLKEADLIHSPHWLRAEEEYITALRVDKEGEHGFFTQLIQRAVLQRFDLICSLAGPIRARETPHAGIRYLEEKLACCDYLPTSPLLGSLLELGQLYESIGEIQRAKDSWQRLLDSDPVDPVDEDGSEAAIRRQARQKVLGENDGSPAATSEQSGCAGLLLVVLLGLGAVLGCL